MSSGSISSSPSISVTRARSKITRPSLYLIIITGISLTEMFKTDTGFTIANCANLIVIVGSESNVFQIYFLICNLNRQTDILFDWMNQVNWLKNGYLYFFKFTHPTYNILITQKDRNLVPSIKYENLCILHSYPVKTIRMHSKLHLLWRTLYGFGYLFAKWNHPNIVYCTKRIFLKISLSI